jgi:hypothetical protein
MAACSQSDAARRGDAAALSSDAGVPLRETAAIDVGATDRELDRPSPADAPQGMDRADTELAALGPDGRDSSSSAGPADQLDWPMQDAADHDATVGGEPDLPLWAAEAEAGRALVEAAVDLVEAEARPADSFPEASASDLRPVVDADVSTDGPRAADGGVAADGEGERIWVYLLAGQSNMVGVGEDDHLAREYATSVPDATIYFDATNHPNPQMGKWLPLGPGLGVDENHFGPELAFGWRMRELFPRRRLAIIKIAEGATRLSDRWRATSGDLYQLLLSETRAQLQVLAQQGRPQIAGLLWMQGESDAVDEVYAEAYQENLTRLVLALRQDLGITLMPVIAGLISSDGGWVYAEVVRDATRQVAAQLGRVDVVESDDLAVLWNEVAHLDSDGCFRLGWRFADAAAALDATRWRFPEDFGPVQGDACWRYGERSEEAGTAMLSFDPARGEWTSDDGRVRVGAGWMQPSNSQQAELGWWAPYAGDVEVTFSAATSSADSDGAWLEVTSPQGARVGPFGVQYATRVWYGLTATVAQGDEIYFRTGSGPAADARNDLTNWQIGITMTRVDE